jgi:hypothetical protein
MNPDELPYAECEFDQNTGKLRKIHFRNCADEADRDRAAKERIEKNRAQLNIRSGLTNRERRALHKCADALEQWLESIRPAPAAEVNDARKDKRHKATGKKLQWLARKFDDQARSQK